MVFLVAARRFTIARRIITSARRTACLPWLPIFVELGLTWMAMGRASSVVCADAQRMAGDHL